MKYLLVVGNLVDIFGIQGVVIAHFISYLLYFGIVLLMFNNSLFGLIAEKEEVKVGTKKQK